MVILAALFGCVARQHEPIDPVTVELARVPYGDLEVPSHDATILALRAHREVLVREAHPARGTNEIRRRLHLHALAADYGEAMSLNGPIGFYGRIDGTPANLHDVRIAQLFEQAPEVTERAVAPVIGRRMESVQRYRTLLRERPAFADAALVLGLLAVPVRVDGEPFGVPELDAPAP